MTLAAPAVAVLLNETVACNCVLDRKVVGKAVPFHWTTEEDAKFVPLTVSVKGPLLASAELGVRPEIVGGGVVTVKSTPLLAPPFTVTTTFPLVAPAGTGTVMPVSVQLVGIPCVPLKDTVLVP